MLSILHKNLSTWHFEIFMLIFPRKKTLKCHSLFFGKNNKKIINLSLLNSLTNA